MIFIDVSEPITKESLIQKANASGDRDIVILFDKEWECNIGGKDTVDALKEANINLHIVYGSFNGEYYKEMCQSTGLDYENLHFWNTVWFNHSDLQFQSIMRHSEYEPPAKFKYPFICLNNRSHFHRCATIEELAKTGLIDKGVVTWHDFLNENPDYPFVFFDRTKKRILNDEFDVKRDSFLMPDEFHDSFFHLVTEATTRVNFITEKTVTPILLKKPFAVVSLPGFHQRLVELGFKLYDEIIDYGFDQEPDLNTRVSMLVEQLHKVCDSDTSLLYNKIKEKILYNYNRALEIIRDGSMIPKIVKDVVTEHKDNPDFNYGYKIFVNQTKSIKVIPRWHNDHNTFLDEIRNEKDTIHTVLLDSLTELNCTYTSPFIENCLELCRQSQIEVELVSPYSSRVNVPFNFMKDPRWRTVKMISWPTYWLVRTFHYMSVGNNRNININNGMDIADNSVCLTNDEFKFLFVSMNNLAKDHRCLLMDLLAKHNAIPHGAISWLDRRRDLDSVRHLIPEGMTDSEYVGYPYKYWKPEILILDQRKTDKFNQEILPIQYKQSFMQLVPETEEDYFFITEKTAVPLLFNKPFLVASSANYHKILQTFGFKLYDEIFDYSFDSEKDISIRYEGIVENVNRLKGQNLIELREKIKDKLMFNRQLALSYVFDNWPKEVLDLKDRLLLFGNESTLTEITEVKKYKNDIY